jgi:uncharacterized protein (TIGR03000 family)
MYSMILMVALTGSTDTIDAHGRRGGGCYGGGYAGCYGGYGYGGCNGGYGYGGCYGSTFGAGCSGWLASCSGYGSGYGGCWGSYGCYGGGYGCNGGGHGRRGGLFGRRHGHSGCNGGCYGGGYGYGCNGGGYGYGCNGGGYGCYGGGYGYGCSGGMVVGCAGGPVTGAPVTGTGEDKTKEMPKGGEPIGEPKEEEKKGVSMAAPGTIIVNLPADARLTVDGVPTSSTSSIRAFATPVLQPGHAYSYTLRAEVTRNGQTVQVERTVPVAAGRTSRVMMDIPAPTQRVASR